MRARHRRALACGLAAVLGLAGVVLCLVGASARVRAGGTQGHSAAAVGAGLRIVQIWPSRDRGVLSGVLLDPANPEADALPFGVARADSGELVCGCTYLYFPLELFPPGTDVRRATLSAYVDSASSPGRAQIGAYRVLEGWEQRGWGKDPATWPLVAASPIDIAELVLDERSFLTPLSLVSPRLVGATEALSPGPELMATPELTRTPLPQATSTPPASPLATPAPQVQPGTALVTLSQVVGTWVTWDVTALMRAWMAQEVPNHGLAIASAPRPDATTEEAGDLLAARWFGADQRETMPFIIMEYDVLPVTPTPVRALLPPAGRAGLPGGGLAVGLLLLGLAAFLVGLAMRRK